MQKMEQHDQIFQSTAWGLRPSSCSTRRSGNFPIRCIYIREYGGEPRVWHELSQGRILLIFIVPFLLFDYYSCSVILPETYQIKYDESAYFSFWPSKPSGTLGLDGRQTF